MKPQMRHETATDNTRTPSASFCGDSDVPVCVTFRRRRSARSFEEGDPFLAHASVRPTSMVSFEDMNDNASLDKLAVRVERLKLAASGGGDGDVVLISSACEGGVGDAGPRSLDLSVGSS